MLDAARLQGERLDLSLCDRAVRDATTVLRPDGSLLLTYAPAALDPGLCAAAFEALKDLHPTSNTRGTAAGGRKRKAPSAVLGFLADDCWSPRCRMTSFTIENGAAYEATLPLINAVSLKYKELAPTHWELAAPVRDTCVARLRHPRDDLQLRHVQPDLAHESTYRQRQPEARA